MEELKKIELFWKWFEKNHKQYLFINLVTDELERERLLDVFLGELHKYCNELYFEMGGKYEEEQVELVITAEGEIEYFPKVEMLIDHAPEMKDWKFIKFKQAQGPGFISSFGSKEFNPEKIIFIPLRSTVDPTGVGIKICYADFTEKEKDIFIHGTYYMLDTLLGEKKSTVDINFLDIIKTPDNIIDYDFKHVAELPAYIEEIKYGK